MKKIVICAGSLLLGIALFVFAVNMIGFDVILAQFQTMNPRFLLAYLGVSLGIVFTLVLKWKLILQALGYSINFIYLFFYKQMGYSIGYLVPSFYIGGETIRGLLLQRKGVPTTDALSSVLIDRTIELPLNFMIACLMFFLVFIKLDLPLSIMIILGCVIAYLVVTLGSFYYGIFNKQHTISKHVILRLLYPRFKNLKRNVLEIEDNLINFYNHRKRFFVIGILFSVVLWALMLLEYKVALLLVGYNASFLEVYLIVTVTGFALMFPVPAALGVMELSQIAVATLIGIPAHVAVALSILIRTRDSLWILTGFFSYLYNGTSYLKDLVGEMMNGKSV